MFLATDIIEDKFINVVVPEQFNGDLYLKLNMCFTSSKPQK